MHTASDAAVTLRALRRVLLAILVVGMAGTAAELLLLDHVEDATQIIPLALIAAGFASLAWNAVRRTRLSVRTLQAVMGLFLVSGLLGIYFHLGAIAEFQLEMEPELTGGNLLWKVLQAKTPPALAPGVMGLHGLIGLAYAYRHPAVALRGDLLQENQNEL